MLCDPSGPRARCLMSPTTRLEKNKRPENHLKMRELVTVLLLAGQCGAFSPSFMTTTGRIGQISSSSMGLRAGSSLVPVRSGASRLSMNSSPQAEVSEKTAAALDSARHFVGETRTMFFIPPHRCTRRTPTVSHAESLTKTRTLSCGVKLVYFFHLPLSHVKLLLFALPSPMSKTVITDLNHGQNSVE